MACDVDTLFVDAAEVFAPQKGATAAQVALLRRRLERLAQVYVRDYGVDVTDLPGSGAGGGLAGGLAAAGAVLMPGFDVVAEAIGLAERIASADLVVTGEGTLDAESFEGKAVGGVVDLAVAAGVPTLIVAGDVLSGELPELPSSVTVVSLVARFGRERAMADVCRMRRGGRPNPPAVICRGPAPPARAATGGTRCIGAQLTAPDLPVGVSWARHPERSRDRARRNRDNQPSPKFGGDQVPMPGAMRRSVEFRPRPAVSGVPSRLPGRGPPRL